MLAVVTVVVVWGLASWVARNDPCKARPDECTWTTMQWLAHGLIPALLLAALLWFVVALIRTVRSIDNRGGR
jgi:hypothetical protein